VLLSKRVDGILLTKAAGEASSGTRRMIADMKGALRAYDANLSGFDR
jgi:hypothetical protein